MAHIPNKSITDFNRQSTKAGSWRLYNGDPAARGYSARWRKVRAWYINGHPLCELCESRGKLTPAAMVHHRQPISEGGPVCDPANLEALCLRCHAERHHKTESTSPEGGRGVKS